MYRAAPPLGETAAEGQAPIFPRLALFIDRCDDL
jgi:hypothetical protein